MTAEPLFDVRPVRPSDRDWVQSLLRQRWGATQVAAHGCLIDADRLPGFIAQGDAGRVGLVTYRIEEPACEVVSLDSLDEDRGVGTALLEAVVATARAAGCRRLWLITTNDNIRALRFYQRRGLRLVAVHRDALDVSRRLKPSIPLIGQDGIPLRDEIELELPL